MSREEAIEILSDMRAEYNLFGDEKEATRYHVLSWAIQNMKAAQQWIPVSERLPEKVTLPQFGEEYPIVIFCTNKEVHIGFYEYFRGGRWWHYTADDEYIVNGVIAWMPLPEPWKGEE